ncbi:MAG: 30S ribosome-binding factor RbfA [Brevinematia bacterium]
MAKEIRVKKMSSFLQEEISEIIHNNLRDENIKGVVSVFDVELSKDLRYATVKLSVMVNSENELKNTVKALIRAKSFVRRKLSKTLKTAYAPELYFEFIDLSRSMKVYEILKGIERHGENDRY